MGIYLGQLPPAEIARLKAELAETIIANFCYPRFFDYRTNSLRMRPVDRTKRQEVWLFLSSVDFTAWNRVDLMSPDLQRYIERLFIQFVQRNRNFFGQQGRKRMPDVRTLISTSSASVVQGLRTHVTGQRQEKQERQPAFGSPRPVTSWITMGSGERADLTWEQVSAMTLLLQQQLQELRGETKQNISQPEARPLEARPTQSAAPVAPTETSTRRAGRSASRIEQTSQKSNKPGSSSAPSEPGQGSRPAASMPPAYPTTVPPNTTPPVQPVRATPPSPVAPAASVASPVVASGATTASNTPPNGVAKKPPVMPVTPSSVPVLENETSLTGQHTVITPVATPVTPVQDSEPAKASTVSKVAQSNGVSSPIQASVQTSPAQQPVYVPVQSPTQSAVPTSTQPPAPSATSVSSTLPPATVTDALVEPRESRDAQVLAVGEDDIVIFEQMRHQMMLWLRVEAVHAGIEIMGQTPSQLLDLLRRQERADETRLQVVSTLLNLSNQVIKNRRVSVLDYKQALMFHLMHTRR